MRDLYSTLFYKIKFTVKAKKQDDDLLWRFVMLIKTWMTNKHNKTEMNIPTNNRQWTALKNGGQINGNNVVFFSEYCQVEAPFPATFWACKIIETQKLSMEIAPRQWTTEIGVEPIEEGKVVFSCIISYSDRPGFVGECEKVPQPSIPRLIRMIWEDPDLVCECGIDRPSAEPQRIVPGEWVLFWARVKDPLRTIPYLYVSPLNFPGDKRPVLVDPEKLALALGGNAMVYYAEDPSVTEEMNYYCPEEYKCYNGSIRIYYPNVDESQPKDSHRHRFLGAGYIQRIGEDGFVQMLRRAIAQDAHFSESFFRTDTCREKREALLRQKRLEEMKRQHLKEKENAESALDMAMEEEQKKLEAQDRAAYFEEENRQLREENFNLRAENDSYISLPKENADLKRACNNRFNTKEYPNTPQEIVHYFEAMFADKIAFSEDAMDSLKDCTIAPEDLWKAFFALATIMDELYISGSGDIYKEFRSKSGIDVGRGEGSMTRQDKKLMRQYETEYHGETIDIEAHITYPKIKQSIHFGFSAKDQKLVVGSCGKHKDNYTTRKVH